MINIIRSKVKNVEESICAFFKLVKKQQQHIVFSIQKNDNKLLSEVLKTENQINKIYFSNFKNTIYNLVKYKLLGIHLRKILAYSYISNELERIGDYIYNTASFLQEKKINSEEREILLKKLNKTFLTFEKIESLFFSKEAETLIKFLKKSVEMKRKDSFFFPENAEKTNEKNHYVFNYCFRSAQRILDHLENIVEYLLLIRSFEEFKNYSKSKF